MRSTSRLQLSNPHCCNQPSSTVQNTLVATPTMRTLVFLLVLTVLWGPPCTRARHVLETHNVGEGARVLSQVRHLCMPCRGSGTLGCRQLCVGIRALHGYLEFGIMAFSEVAQVVNCQVVRPHARWQRDSPPCRGSAAAGPTRLAGPKGDAPPLPCCGSYILPPWDCYRLLQRLRMLVGCGVWA